MIVESQGMQAEADVPLADLVLRIRDGDASAFERLYERLARSVHAVLLARVSPVDAEELTQEVFLAAHRRLGELRDPAVVGPWLHAMARNLAIDHWRARARRPKQETLDHVNPPVRLDEDAELRGRVVEQIRELPSAYQETLMMRLVDGLTGPQIAEATGMTPGSVRVNLCRGMELLRARLREEGWP